MIQTIRIGTLLRETVASPYRNLVTRPTGAAIRNRIQAAIADSDCHTALLDFSDIELLDLSCADEVVAKLLLGWVTADARTAFACLCERGAQLAVDLAGALGWPAARAAAALEALVLHRVVQTDGDRYQPLPIG